MITYEEFITALNTVTQYRDQINQEIYSVSNLVKQDPIEHLDISIRLMNALRYHYKEIFPHRQGFQDVVLSDLEGINIKKLYGMRNIGNKSIAELKDLCRGHNITYIES